MFALACKRKEITLLDIRNISGKSFNDSQKIADKLITQVLLSGTTPGKFMLSSAMHERFKDYDGPAPDSRKAHDEAHEKVHDEAHDHLTETELQILRFSTAPKSTSELLQHLGYRSRTGNYKSALSNLLSKGYLEMTIPESPRSKNQKYRLTQTGKHLVETLKRLTSH